MSATNSQITSTSGFNVSNIIFSEPVSGSIPDSKPKIEFKRINISVKNNDGTTGELILPTSRLFSFGVSENVSQETGKVNGYTFPLCLWNKDNPTDEEKEWTTTFDNIVDKCIDHLVDVREDIDMFDLSRADLMKSKGGFNPLYWKKEKYTDSQGKAKLRVVPGSGPTLYTKLIFSKKSDKFLSQFFDLDDEPLNALDLMGKYCYTTAAIKIESIFIGSKISLQVKLYEAVIEPISSGMKRLLSRPKSNSKVLEFKSNSASHPLEMNTEILKSLDINDEEEDEKGSLVDDLEDLEDPEPVVEKPVKTVKRVKKVNK